MKKPFFKKNLSNLQVIALGFFIIIMLGALLLTLPVSVKPGGTNSFQTALFTAASATCVTGLVLVDTFSNWTVFGQLVILVLIQIGGLGFMTIATFFLVAMRRQIGLKEKEVMLESFSASYSTLRRITKIIFLGTGIIELVGAGVLCIRFVPRFGLDRGIYYGVFHSVSAFCNAGFDLMGIDTPFNSFCDYVSDPLVTITLMVLITLGGLGFLLWDDVMRYRFRIKRYTLTSKVALSFSALLVFGGALLLWFSERDAAYAGLDGGGQLLASLFSSVTARTAGFNTVDVGGMSQGGKLVTMMLMFIGGSPGSTAGGIKTTSMAVLLVYTFAGMTRSQSTALFGRRIDERDLHRAVYVFFANLLLTLGGSLMICCVQPLPLTDVVFETFSAIGTVGMSTGITRELNAVSQYIVIFLMYCGRVGSVSFVSALLERRAKPMISCPVERITMG